MDGLIYSNLLIILFSIITLIIFSKNVKKDIDNYNFRVVSMNLLMNSIGNNYHGIYLELQPKSPMLLSSFIGTGFQLFLMVYFLFIYDFLII